MKRTTVAFLVAGLWVPAALGLNLLTLQYGNFDWWALLAPLFIGAAVSYGVMIAIGLPLYRRFRGPARFWRVVGIGAMSGFVVALAYLLLIVTLAAVSHTSGMFGNVTESLPTVFAFCGALGALSGATYWRIARPDRTTSPVQHF